MKKFENAEINVVEFFVDDVIATSGLGCGNHCDNYSGDDSL